MVHLQVIWYTLTTPILSRNVSKKVNCEYLEMPLNKKSIPIREIFHRFTTINLDIFEKNAKTAQLSYYGLDETQI